MSVAIMLRKLIDNPLTIPLLQLLATKPMTIPQVADQLKVNDKETDISLIFALTSELHRLGIIQKFENRGNNIKKRTSHKDELTLQDETLGMPLPDYISTWESLRDERMQIDLNKLNNWMYCLPHHLTLKFKDSSPDEIRKIIIGALTANTD